MISATSVLASRHAIIGNRLDTLLLRLPRMLLPEFNTHRVFSRNAASTRAIPTGKLIRQVREEPFVPLHWGANKAGMQAGDTIANASDCETEWLAAAKNAADHAERLSALGLHKQIAGRVLEPFMWTTVVVSSTEWGNFLAQRDHEDAEPHMQILAREVRKAIWNAEVQELQPGEWHLPFVTDVAHQGDEPMLPSVLKDMVTLSVARCASTSYKTVDGFDMSLDRATEIYDKLISADPIHASPFEHVAQADEIWGVGGNGSVVFSHPEQHRNFVGFRQLRAMIEEGMA